jgi:crotonobetainyl-CoA:carnitine CoA-transferase CaiB-like acyl-CoA transferase
MDEESPAHDAWESSGRTRAAAQLLPLRGVSVLELAQNLAGPYCAQILADLGADVIKVEGPAGDAARAWGPPFIDGAGSIFVAANRGKRSVTLDLRDDADRLTLGELIERCDVLIEAFRPGTFARLGFDAEAVHAINPRVIYASVLAYGESGPLSDLPGYDPLMQAHGGLMSITGDEGSEGVRVGTSVIDMGTGMWLTIAIMAALRERDRNGRGTRLSVALYDTALAWSSYHIGACVDTGFVPSPMGSELPMIAPYGAFQTADGRVMIAAGNDGLFRRLCAALELSVLPDDVRYRHNSARVAHRTEVNAAVSEATSARTVAEVLTLLRSAGVPCAPILDIEGVLAEEQTRAADMIERGNGPTAVRLPIRWNGERTPAGRPPPRAGEHTAAILRALRDA